jgi:transcriptional regulator with XRE-family HTH domain
MVAADAPDLGRRLRDARLARAAEVPRDFSVRALAARIGVSAAYLSLVERGAERPTETVLRALAAELGLDAEPLLPLAGRIAGDVATALIERPALAELVRALRDLPEPDLQRMIRQVRDGDW